MKFHLFPPLLALALIGASRDVVAEPGYPPKIQTILENTAPLPFPRGNRLPLFLWPAHGGVVDNDVLQERMIRELNKRGIALISTWDWNDKEKSLAESLRIARIQKSLGLRVCVNANACMYGFFNGDQQTAHVDRKGNRFFDDSIPGKIGCPFRIDHRFAPMRKKIDFFVKAYEKAGVPLDFVFGDWEIDGPLEINRAWEAAKRCVVCREKISGIHDFRKFQQIVRDKRSEATRQCYAEPILERFPKAWVGNYGVYPNDGHRYWFDYFEKFFEKHPHRLEQKAPYREWVNDFPSTGYTLAMPVVYPWARIFHWYDFSESDYRWFYNMLLVASNADGNTSPNTPVVPFVHWHTVFDGGDPDTSVRQMSRHAYQELLWHMLLRGSDSFFMWCPDQQSPDETRLVHEAWSAALEYRSWLNDGVPITFEVSPNERTVISGLRVEERVLVRRTDFSKRADASPIRLKIGEQVLVVPSRPGLCQVLEFE